MDDQDIKLLEERLDTLLKYCEALRAEKDALSEQLKAANAALDKMRDERNTIRERVVGLIDKIDRLGDMSLSAPKVFSTD